MKYLALAVVFLAMASSAQAEQAGDASSDCARIVRAHWGELSQGDRSVVFTSLQTADSAVATVEGSPLAPVYAELEMAGFMRKLDEGLPPPILQYEWTEQGRAQCAVLFAAR